MLALPACGMAQAVYTASRSAGISTFAGYVNSDPNYGPDRDEGEAFGANYIQYFPHALSPSLEIRYNHTTGTDVNQNSFLGGVRLQYDAYSRFRIHPYIDVLMGRGTIHFNTNAPGNTSENSAIYNFGGGVDVDLTHHFQFKTDYQFQRWSFGQPSVPFTPNLLLVGFTYRFFFRGYTRQADFKYLPAGAVY